jgi:hypothetical protein
MSNPHVTEAERLVNADGGWTVGYETADAQHIVGLLDANMQATLALAYEQRTANLIALWSNPQASGMNGDVTWGVSDERIGELLQEIQQRLGVKL